MIRRIVTDRGDSGRRLDLVFRRHLADLRGATRTRVQAWILDGAVTVNGRAVLRTSARVVAGDVLTVDLPAGVVTARPAMPAQELALETLYEDEHLIAINKPPGLVVHPTYRHTEGTVMNALLWQARGWRGSDRPSMVNRLDKLTSGIVIGAKTARAHAAMQRALAGDRAAKEYLALVYGRVPRARGTIDLRIRRDPGDRRRVVASSAGAPSVTHWERLGRGRAEAAGLTLLKCRLVTGRTHQIRVHLAASGWPIVGDAKYGQPLWRDIADADLRESLRAFPRQALHAWRLAVIHPMTGAALRIEAPPPADLQRLLTAAGLVQCAR
jgi:23S rRNA pseudouridine1911/1915/1917 synthase